MEQINKENDGYAELHEMLGEWKMFSTSVLRRLDKIEDELKNGGARRVAVAAACVSILGGLCSFANIWMGWR